MDSVVVLVCKKCGYEWETIICTVYGHSLFLNDEEAFCPECGGEGDVK